MQGLPGACAGRGHMLPRTSYTTQSQQPQQQQQQQHQTQIAFDAGLNLSDDEETVPINKALDK